MPEFDEFGIPIRSKSNTAVDEFGIPIKKKETTVSPSVQKPKPISSGTQSKANQKPLATSVSGKPEGLYTFPGNTLAVFKKTADGWYVDNRKSGDFIKLQKGDVAKRTAALEKQAETLYDKDYEKSLSWKWEEKPKVAEPKKQQTNEQKQQEELFKDTFKVLKEDDPIVIEKENVSKLSKDVSSYVNKSEGQTVEDLTDKFKNTKYDIFNFEETGVGDMLKVTNKKTGQNITIDLDGSENEKKMLESFIESNLSFREYNNLIEKRSQLESEMQAAVSRPKYEIEKELSNIDEKIKEQEFYRKGYALSKGTFAAAAMYGDKTIRDVNEKFNDNVSRIIGNSVILKEEIKKNKEYDDKLKSDYSKGLISKDQYDNIVNSDLYKFTKDDLSKRYKDIVDESKTINDDRDLMEKTIAESRVAKEERGDIGSNLLANFAYGFVSPVRMLAEIDAYNKPVYDSKGNRVFNTETLSKSESFQDLLPGVITDEYMTSSKTSDLEKALAGVAESLGAAIAVPVPGAGAVATKIGTEAAKRTGLEIVKSIAKKSLLSPQQLGLFASSYMNFKDQINSDPETEKIDEADKVLLSGAYAYVSSKLESFGMSKWFSKTPAGTKITSYVVAKAFKDLPKDASQEAIDNAINSSVKGLITKGAISLTAKGNIEGTTEALQELADIGVKYAYNELKGNEVFKNPSYGQIVDRMSESYKLGLIGGVAMSSVSQIVSTAKETRTALQIKQLENLISDPNVKKLFEDDVKTKIISGQITKEQGKKQIDELNDSISLLDEIPDNVKDKTQSFRLLNEKRVLEEQIAGKDENLVSAQKARIADINNELKTISENAVKESNIEEVTAEGGGVQYQGTQEGQPEVRETERPVGQAAQPETNLGNRPVEGRGVQEEIKPLTYTIKEAFDIEEPIVDAIPIEKNTFYHGTDNLLPIEKGNINTLENTRNAESKYFFLAEKPRTAFTYSKDSSGEKISLKENSGVASFAISKNAKQYKFTKKDTELIKTNEDFESFLDSKKQEGYDVVIMTTDANNRVILNNDIISLKNTYKNIKPATVVQEEATPDIVPIEPTVAEETINKEVDELEKLLKGQDPNFQLDSEITQEEKKEELVSKAIDKMSESDISEMSEEAFEAEFPTPDVKTYPIEVKENSELASKLKRMGLKDLIGKKINLVMADQLKVGEVMGRKRMGGPFFPLIDKLFGKVAWASMNEDAANKIINGAVKSDYTVVYNMSTTAIDSNVALTETFEDLTQSLPKNKQKEIFSAIQEQVLKNQYGKKTDQVRSIAKSSKTLNDFFTELDKLDVDTISAVVKNIMPSRNVDAATRIGKLLQDEGITIETVREMNIEQFASNLPTGALLMVIEVTDKSGKKVTKETAKEALITPEQQDEEGLPKHNNYPIYVRGKAVALLNETVPFWNMLKGSINNINTKVAGIVREKSGRRLTSKEALSNEMRSASMTAMVAKTVSDKINTQYNRFVSAISKSFPNVEVVASQEEFDALLRDLNTKKLSTKNAKVYGAVYKGKLYLNPSLENYNTPIHEFGHIWINTAKVASKQLYDKGVSLVKGTDYENNVRENKEYQRVIKQMKADGASDIDIDNYIYEEALATAIGDKGESFVTASQRLEFKNWMRKLFSFVKSMTGISKYNAEQLEDITLDEFVQAVSVDIMSGTQLFKGAKTNLSDALQLMTNDSNSIEYIMSVARDNGISDAAIKKYLSNKGFSEQEIKSAFKKQPKAPSVEKILGKPAPKKMIVNEAVALRDQLRLEARAARESAMDLKRKQRALVAVVNGMKRNGSINVNQATALAKRIVNTNLDNPVMVKRMLDYAERLFKRADYQEVLKNAFGLRNKIRKAAKSKGKLQAEVAGMAKKFSKIDPSLVEDIDLYMEIAEKVYGAVRPVRLIKTGLVTKIAADIAKISEYQAEEIKRQDEILKNEAMDMHKYLVDSGAISSEMSLKEIRDVITILENDPEADVADRESIIRDYVKKAFDVYSGIIIDMVKTGIDPMTGEEVSFDEKQKDIIKRLIGIDTDFMKLEDAYKSIEALDNFIVNKITSGVEAIVNSYEGKLNAEAMERSGIKTRPLKLFFSGVGGRVMAENFASLPVLIDTMFGGINAGQKFMNLSGLNEFANGVASATREQNNIINEYGQKFEKSKPNGMDFRAAENVYERGMLAYLSRTIDGTSEQQRQELGRRINIVKDSIDALSNGDKDQKKISEIYQSLYDKLGLDEFNASNDNLTLSDIQSRADKTNLEATSWWIEKWAEKYSDLSDVSLSVYNTELGSDINYTPDRYSKVEGEEDPINDINLQKAGAFGMDLNFTDKNKTGVLMETTRPKKTPGRYVNLDFDISNARSMKAALVDINTAASVRKIDGFLRSPSMNKIIEDKKDKQILQRRINNYVRRSKHKAVINDATLRELDSVFNYVASIGAVKALGGIFQPIKQTMPVMINTIINAGPQNMSLASVMGDSDMHEWINNSGMAIANRGMEASTTVETANKYLDKVAGSKKEALGKGLMKINEFWLKKFLQQPDVWIARSSFISYYKQALRRKGVDVSKIDWKNHPVDKEAANYAQHMVDRQQNVSDAAMMGEIMASESGTWKIARKTLLPFANFIMNQKSRMYSDFRTAASSDATKEDKIAALRSLGGLTIELAAYQYIGYLTRELVKSLAANLVGYEPDDEEEEKNKKYAIQNASNQYIKDVLSPLPLTDGVTLKAFDFIADQLQDLMISDDEIKNAITEENKAREEIGEDPMTDKQKEKLKEELIDSRKYKFEDYKNDKLFNLGTLSIAFDKSAELWEMTKMAKTGEFTEDSYGTEKTKYINKADQKKMAYLSALKFASLSGALPVEANNLAMYSTKYIKKRAMTENQKDMSSELMKEMNIKELKDYQIALIENKKSVDSVIEEVDWVESNGGLKNKKQQEEYIRILEKNGEVTSDDLYRIQRLK